jgi:uncharacterized membrane protein
MGLIHDSEDERQRVIVEYLPHGEISYWSPKARVVAGLAGVAALIVGQRTKGVVRQLAWFTGISLGLRAWLNKDLTQVIGTLLSPSVRLNAEIIVDAPPSEVASFWSRVENYPRFMSFVRKLEFNRFGNLEWCITGPGGMEVHWESYVQSWAPSGVIAWVTVPGSPVYNSGRVGIEPLDFEQTRVRVELVYALRSGSLGYAAVRALGFDPRDHFDENLSTMKTIIEKEWRAKRDVTLPLSS